MKILFFSRLFYPHVGGVEKHIEKISELLIEQGHEVVVITTKHEYDLTDNEDYKGIEIIRFNQPKIRFLGLLYTWYWVFKNRSLIKESDVLHIHDVFVWYLPFKLLIPSKEVYLTMHGWEGEYPIPFYNKLQKKMAVSLCDASFAVGKFIEKYYGVSADIVTYGAVKVPSHLSRKNDNEIVYVGRLDEDTGIKSIFKVFEKLDKNFNVVFCGDGELRHEAEKYGEVKGFVDPAPYFKKAKYCFASGYLTILEALANKCLVIAMYDNELKADYYKLTPFNKFIIASDNPDYIVDRLNYYATHNKEADEMIEKGYEWTKQQSWKKLTEQYLTLWYKN